MADYTQIIQEINTNLPDNTTQAITAAKVRTTLTDMINAVGETDNRIEDILPLKQDVLDFDSTPMQNSTNPVTSDGIYNSLSGKADKVSNPTSGNFAGLDSNGNLTDSGSKANDFATASQGAKADNAILFVEQDVLTDQQRNTALANVSNQTANSTTGKIGYKVLEPTKTFASQVTAGNTIYEIRDVFDLNNGSVTIPSYCTLKFNGGKIKNSTIVLSSNCSIDNGLFEDCKLKLNTFNTISNCVFDNGNSYQGNSVLECVHTDAGSGQILNIKLFNLEFRTGTTYQTSAIRFYADTQTDNTNAAGGYGITMENINVRGRFNTAIEFDGQYSNSWFTEIIIQNVFFRTSKVGISTMLSNGFSECVKIADVSYQGGSDSICLAKINNTRNINFHNCFLYDTSVIPIYANDACYSISITGNSNISKIGNIGEITNNFIWNIGSTEFPFNEGLGRNILDYLDINSEVTLGELAVIPNGIYYLVPSASGARDKLLSNWGLMTGDSNTSNVSLIIRKEFNFRYIIVEVFSAYLNAPAIKTNCCKLYGQVTTTAIGEPIKSMWVYSNDDVLKTNTQFNRINQFREGMFVYKKSEKKLMFYNEGTWYTPNGFVYNTTVGDTSSRPSLGVDDKGYQYFDTTLGKYICWNGTAWVNLDGTSLS